MENRTIKELKEKIRDYVKEVNERLEGYFEAGEKNVIVEKEKARLEAGGSKMTKGGTKLSEGFSYRDESGKRIYLKKSELEERERELKRFLQNDIYTPAGAERFKENKMKSYDTFRKRYGDLSVSDWQKFYQSLDDIKNTLSDYKYETYQSEIANQFSKSSEDLKERFVDVAAKAQQLVDLKTKNKKAKDSEILMEQIAQLRKAPEKDVKKLLNKKPETIARDFNAYERAKRKLMDDQEISERDRKVYDLYRQFEFFGEDGSF